MSDLTSDLNQLDDAIELIDDETEVVTDKGSKLDRLEAEGEYAADYLEELLDIADLDGDIEIDVDNGRALVEIVTEGQADRRLKRLIGREGEVLDALQELTRLAVQERTGERSRLMLDIAGFRAERRGQLREMVAGLIEKVRQTGEPVALEPMNPFERKVCHDAVAAAGLYSESEGVYPNRHVVIHLGAPGEEEAGGSEEADAEGTEGEE